MEKSVYFVYARSPGFLSWLLLGWQFVSICADKDRAQRRAKEYAEEYKCLTVIFDKTDPNLIMPIVFRFFPDVKVIT